MLERIREYLRKKKEPPPPLRKVRVRFRIVGPGFDLTFSEVFEEVRFDLYDSTHSIPPEDRATSWLERIAKRDGLWMKDEVYYPPHAIERVVVEEITEITE